jgi:crossover junction endodeoxyribonuclease RusA
MPGEFTIRLSWPAKALWQNRPSHWAQKAKAKSNARAEAWALANGIPKWPNAVLEFQFMPPDKRRRDLHNMPATQKAAIDGIADAMGCDDNGFRCIWPTRFGEVVPGGAVYVTIKEGKANG